METTMIVFRTFRLFIFLGTFGFATLGFTQNVDHFEWNVIASPQTVNGGFSASIYARDLQNNPASNFNGSVHLLGVERKSPGLLITEIDTGVPDRVEFINLGEKPCNIGGWRISLYDSSSYPSPKITFVVPSNSICPPKTPFQLTTAGTFPGSFPSFSTGAPLTWTNTSIGTPITVLLQDEVGKVVDVFSATTGFCGAITNPIAIPSSEWLGLPVANNPDAKKTYQRIGKDDLNSSTDWTNAISSVGAMNPGLAFSNAEKEVASVPVDPPSVTFTNGVWTGSISINSFSESVILRADDFEGHPGDSNPFAVLDELGLQLEVPAELHESAAGVTIGVVRIRQAKPQDVAVLLNSSLPNEIAITASITIPAGSSNATFYITNFDDGLLDGNQFIEITGSSDDNKSAGKTIKNIDDEAETLSLVLPASVQESAVSLVSTGKVVIGTTASGDFMINLSCNRSNELQLPSRVLLPFGQTSAVFNISVIDDNKLNGPRIASILASFSGWNAAAGQISIVDNENTNLALTIPTNLREGDGVLTNVGTVKLFAVPLSSVTVSLASSNTAELQVPPSVIIPAGQTTAVFSVSVIDDAITDGSQSFPVVGTAPGLSRSQVNVTVRDNDVHHFQFSPIYNPQALGRLFPVTINAVDINGITIGNFNGTANLSATSPQGPVLIEQSNLLQFTNGVWSGLVSIPSQIKSVSLICEAPQGQSGSSSPFDIFGRVLPIPNSDVVYSPVSQKLYVGALNSYGTNGQSVIQLDPQTAQASPPIFIQNQPGPLAVSDNGQYLYVGLNTTGGVARINLATNAIDQQFSFGADSQGPLFAEDLKVIPGNPTFLAASLYSFSKAGIALFANGIMKSNFIPALPWNTSQLLETTDSTNTFYAVFDRGIRKISITPSGLTDSLLIWDQIYRGQVEFADGALYGTTGQILNTNNLAVATNIPVSGIVEPVTAENRIYFTANSGTFWVVRVVNLNTLEDLGTIGLPQITGTPVNLEYCDNNTLALGTANEVVLFGSLPAPKADLVVSQTVSPNPAVFGSNLVFSVTVSNFGPDSADSVVLTNTLVTGLDFVSATTSQGTATHQNGIVTANIGRLGNGNTATVTVVTTPRASGIAVNSIGVNGSVVDQNPANNQLTQTIVIPYLGSTNAIARLSLPARDLIYDPVTKRIYVSVSGSGGIYANSITEIDPETLSIGASHPVGQNPGKLAIAENGRVIFVALDGESAIRSFDTVTGVSGAPFSIGVGVKVYDMEVLQGTTNSVVVSKYTTGFYDYAGDIYDNGIKRSNTLASLGPIELSGDPNRLFGLLFSQSGGGFLTLAVTPSGLVITNSYSLGNLYATDFEVENGLAYFGTAGSVVDPTTGQFLQSYPGTLFDPIVRPDAINSRVFYLSNDGRWFLQENDLTTRALLKFVDLSPLAGQPANLIRWSTNGLALCTKDGGHLGPSKDEVFILRFSGLPLLPTAELAISQSVSSTNSIVGSNFVYTINVTNNGPDTATNMVVTDTLPAGATFVSATVSQGTFNTDGSVVSFQIGTLTNGGHFSADLKIIPSVAGLSTNSASVSAAQNDYTLVNNQSSLTTVSVYSNTLALLKVLSLPVNDIIYNETLDEVFASVRQNAGLYSNCIVGIDRRSGSIHPLIQLTREPELLAITADGQFLYTSLVGTGIVERVNMSNSAIDLTTKIDQTNQVRPFWITDLEVMPGHPETIVVSSRDSFAGYDPKIEIYDNAVRRPSAIETDSGASYFYVEIPDNGANVFALSPFGFQDFTVSSSGLTPLDSMLGGYEGDFCLDAGLIFTPNGKCLNPASRQFVTNYPVSGVVAANTDSNEVFYIQQSGNVFSGPLLTVKAFAATNASEKWSLKIPSGLGAAKRLVRLGTNGLAFCSDGGRIVFVDTPLLQPNSSDLSVSLTASASSPSLGATINITATVTNNGYWTASNVVAAISLPSGIMFNSASASRGTFTQTNGLVTFSPGSLTNGSIVSLTINATTTNLGSFTNTIVVTHSGNDPISTNDSAALVTVVTPRPSISVSDIAVLEGNGPSSFLIPVLLSAPSPVPVSVQYRITNGTAIGGIDFRTNAGMTGTISFPTGVTNRSIFISGGLLGNTIVQSNRYFSAILTNATNAELSKPEGSIWIIDDDFYKVSISPVSVVEGNSGYSDASVLLTITPSNTIPVTLQYETLSGTAAANSDFIPKSGSISFPPGITSRMVNIAVKGETLLESDESFIFRILEPVNALAPTNAVPGIILDDDVLQPLTITMFSTDANSVSLTFDSVEGRTYWVQRSESLATGDWSTLAELFGTGQTLFFNGVVSPDSQKAFYRVVLAP